MLLQGPDFWRWFDKIQFSYHCVHLIHAKMFSIQMFLCFSQIVLMVCTLVLFIIIVVHVVILQYIIIIIKYMQKAGEPENDAGFLKVYICNYNNSYPSKLKVVVTVFKLH